MRLMLVALHRWAGLLMAAFLFVAGLTGAVISWDHEIDEWLNPHLTDARTTGSALSSLELATSGTTAGGWVMLTALQAFVLGTYDRLTLTRTAKGKVTLTKRWRVGFVPLAPKLIRWREHEGVAVRHSDVGCLEWAILFMLLPGIVLPVLCWWFAIRPGRVMVALTQNLGDPVSILYAGTDVGRATEIAETVRDLTGLPYDPLG